MNRFESRTFAVLVTVVCIILGVAAAVGCALLVAAAAKGN